MRALLVFVAVAPTLAACASPGEEHLVGEQRTPTSTVRPTADSQRTAPDRPGMQPFDHSAEGQVRYALALIDFAKETGETQALLGLSKEGCVPCADAYKAIKAGDRGSVMPESVIAGSSVAEGNNAQVSTLAGANDNRETRIWRTKWNGTVWQFGSIVSQ